jgi:hypothetical protein
MSEHLVSRESAVEYFKELVETAIAHQGLAATELTTYYVVQLLAGSLEHSPGDEADDGVDEDVPLALRLFNALESGGPRRRTTLKRIGDRSLFVSGFFSDSLQGTLVDVDYYVSIGGFAYQMLSRIGSDTFSPVFAELGDKFVSFVDVLSEISERTSCASNADVLRLYERWLKTRSPRSGRLLVERGVMPNAGASTRTH